MSISEMKLIAISEITKLENENAVKEILDHLAKINTATDSTKSLNLFQHYDKIKEQYSTKLQKLAQ